MTTSIVCVHGIGEQKPGYSQKYRQGVEGQLGTKTEWHEVFWADVAHQEEALVMQLTDSSSLARKLLVYFGGDVVGYIPPDCGSGTYNKIQERFQQVVAKLPPGRVVLVGHSLGSVVISDGVWDMQKHGAWPAGVELHGVVTFGSPIALYAMRCGLSNFTHPIRPKYWTNLWYESDPIGYTLHINDVYKQVVTRDEKLGLYGLRRLISWVPLVSAATSHLAYAGDDRVAKAIADLVRAA
jgi:hypothetical protein